MISPVWYHVRYREGKAYPSDVYASDEEYRRYRRSVPDGAGYTVCSGVQERAD